MKQKFKRGLAGVLGLAMAGAMLLTPLADTFLPENASEVHAEVKTGWSTESGSGKTYYYDALGNKKYLLQSIGGKKYYFDRFTGEQQTGWVEYGGKKYYFQSHTDPEKRFALKGTWENIDGKVYRFDDTDCSVLRNQWITSGSMKAYLTEDGSRAVGFTKIDNEWYYFNSTTGSITTGSVTINGQAYTFDSNGVMTKGKVPSDTGSGTGTTVKNGWKKVSGKWYYYVKGKKVTGWKKIGTKKYYFNAKGVMVTGWKKIGTKKYYFNAKGAMVTGWKKIGTKKYYFNAKGAMVTGWKKIKNKMYFFKKTGVMAKNEYIKGYYMTKTGARSAKAKCSWKKTAKGKRYSNAKGWYAKSCTLTIDGKKYTFKKNGYVK